MSDGVAFFRNKKISHRRLDDISGKRFGSWVAIGRGANDKQGKPQWLCLCDCGTESLVRSAALRSGSTNSCGCQRTDRWLATGASVKHGMTTSREWQTWHRMKQRCMDPNQSGYAHYGGRGIIVCERWRDSFEAFYEDMGPRPSDTHSIDRIDPNGNYEPGNCRWATIEEQNSNKTSNVFVEANGERLTLAAWARRLGTSQTTLSDRMARGWSPVRAVTEPVNRRKSRWRKTG